MKLAASRPALLFAALAGLAFLFFAEPFAAPPDCASYWAWGESLLRDLDFDFSNQYERAEMPAFYVYATKTDRLANDWPMGSGLALVPWLAGGKMLAQAWVCLLVAGAMTLAAPLVAACRSGRAFALGSMLLGTPLFFYAAFGPFFSHAVSFAATTAFLVAWAKTRGTRSPAAWWLLGLLLGFAALIRPQNLLLGVVFLTELPSWRAAANRPPLRSLAACPIAALLAFAPAMIGYQMLYGSPLALPKAEEMHWLSPALAKTLLSDFHGVLPWTPVYALGIGGLFLLAKRDRTLGIGLLLVFAVQLYLNAANLVWWSGGSFGNRRLADSAIVVAFGLGALWQAAQSRPGRIALIGTTALCVAWTATLMLAERRLLVPLDRYIPFTDSEFPNRIAGVFTAPLETWRATARPFIAALDSGGELATRVVCAALLAAGVLALARLGSVRPARGRAAIASIAGTCVALVLTLACAVAAARTPRIQSERMLKNIPRQPSILWDNYVELAYYHVARREFQEAEVASRNAIALRPEHPTPWWYLSVALYEQGHLSEAVASVRHLYELNPEHEGARQLIARIVAERSR